MKFGFISQSEISDALFEKHPAWASYYEPDDIDAIANWGIDRGEIVKMLESIEYSDDYIFPMLSVENEYPFKFEYYKAIFTTPSGIAINGYTIGTRIYAIGIFTHKDHYILNLNLKDRALEAENRILSDIGMESDTLFPLYIDVNVMSMKLSADFDPNA